MRMESQPDKRYFFGVADRTEPSGGQGFQYDRLVRSILYEAGSDNMILSGSITGITSASFARTAGSETVSSGFASSFGGTDALTSVRENAGKARANHSRFLHNIVLKLGAFPIRCRQFPCFLLSPLPRLSPPLFLFLVQLLAPDPNGGDA